MTAYELAHDYATAMRAMDTVEGMLRAAREWWTRTSDPKAAAQVRKQKRRLAKIRKAVGFIERALGRVDCPTKKCQVASVWPDFVDRLTGHLTRSWRLRK